MATTVLVADDEPRLRELLALLVGSTEDFELVGLAGDAAEAIVLAQRVRPDVALLDVRMPGGGPHAAREIHRLCPRTRIVAFTAHTDRAIVLDMLRSGATSYALKGTTADELIETIRRAARGESVLAAEVASDVIAELSGHLAGEHERRSERDALAARIHQAIDHRGLDMVCQPIVDLDTATPVGFEALARFHPPPDQGPDRWFAQAASVSLGVELELAAVTAALALAARLPATTFLAINLSPNALPMCASLLAHAAASHRIVVEITEHAAVDDYAALGVTLDTLRLCGVGLAVDDAGAGFASLRHTLQLAPNFIKLDVSLTRSIDIDPRRQALARGMVTFADESQAEIIAEGIETPAQLDALRTLGVRFGQGYLLGAPRRLPGQHITGAPAGTGE